MNDDVMLKISLTVAIIMSFVGFLLGVMVNPNWLSLIVTAIVGMIIVIIWLTI